MQDGALPWEASRTTLDLLRYSRELGVSKPTIHVAQLFWRVTLAAPDMELAERFQMAQYLDFFDTESDREQCARSVEAYLMLSPWKSQKDAGAYKKSVQSGEFPPTLHHGFLGEEKLCEAIRAGLSGFELWAMKQVPALRRKLGREPTLNDLARWRAQQKSRKIGKERKA